MDTSLQKIYSTLQKGRPVCIDSRKTTSGSVFFALRGDNFDGNTFAEKAIAKGALIAVIDKPSYKKNDKYIVVDNVLDTLQQLAFYHRKRFSIPVIGITGTNGKTTTKELLNAVLSQNYCVLATEGNLNNHIGVPLMLLKMSKEHQIAIIEMGANHIGEIADLCKLALPTHGIITNIGKAHLEGFKNIEGVIEAKRALYEALRYSKGVAFVNKDDDLLVRLSDNLNTTFYSSAKPSECHAVVKEASPFITLKCTCNDISFEIKTKLYGQYNLYNLLASICIGLHFGVGKEAIIKGLSSYTPSNNRTQVIKTKHNTIFLDAYNANPSSMELAIKSFEGMSLQNKILIAGDMREMGEHSTEEHQRILKLIESCDFAGVFLVGNEFSRVNNTTYKSFPDVSSLSLHLKGKPIKDASVFVKGSRGIELEKIIDFL